MSDLDADLYGDLYENEHAERTHDKAPATSSMKSEEPKAENSPAMQASTPKIIEASIPIFTQPELSSPSSSIALQIQQIPTYEDNPEQVPQLHAAGGYQTFAANERSVRPSEMKDEGKMFIGGLNWDTTDDGLHEYFSQFGKVDACTIMRDPTGRSRCFAFLTFEDPASVNKVMVQEHFLDGKIIDPKRAIPRQEHQRATKLFIGGLPGTVTSESMREFFSQFGKVVESTVMLDQKTGRSKGFGFISLEDTNVQPFLGFGNLEIDGKLIDVKLAQPRYQREAEQEGGAVTGGSGNFSNRAGAGGGFDNNNFNGNIGNNAVAGNTPFDPRALAALYTRMFQMANNGMGNMGMMGGGMNPMGGMMGRGGMMGMSGNGNMSMNGMGGMARGFSGPGMVQGAVSMGQNIPKGPRGGAPPQSNAAPPSVGPQRAAQRGQHSFHPYSRP
ncbi:heterogeneous nuclear ribonucleoprotein hrp1 [Moniliophthora roreri]|nr:heterogeneous nuclear ribonucleoprotein hrp1 [Moniliophthora roreri]